MLGVWFGKQNCPPHYVYIPIFIISEILTLSKILLLNQLCAFTGILSVIFIAGKFPLRTLCIAGKYSMDIYIFHVIVMVMFRIPLYSIMKINFYVCTLILFAAGVILPVIISRFIIRRSKILKLLLLGMK